MNTIGSQNSNSELRKQPPPHEQLQEQRSQLKKILEEHRQKEAEEELLSFSNNFDVLASGLDVIAVDNTNYENLISEGFPQPPVITPKPVQILDISDAIVDSSYAQQSLEFDSQEKHHASIPVQLETSDLATLTNVNLHWDSATEREVTAKDYLRDSTPPAVLPFYPKAHKENAVVHPSEAQAICNHEFDSVLEGNGCNYPPVSPRKLLPFYSTSIAGFEVAGTEDLASNSGENANFSQTAIKSSNQVFTAPEGVSTSGNLGDLHHYSVKDTDSHVHASPSEPQCNSSAEGGEFTGTINEEPESDSTSNPFHDTDEGNKNAGALKTINVTVIGPDSLAVPMKRSRKEYFKLQKENVNFKKPLLLQCEWSECITTFSESKKFLEHVELHISQYDGNEENECIWHLCDSKWQDYEEFRRHVFFHAFHACLKAKGEQVRAYQSLPPCYLDTRGQNSVPQIPQAFECQFDDCNEIFQSAHYFYWHVAMHINNMDVSIEGGKEIFRCGWGECKVAYNRRSRLAEHCQSHTQEKLFACINCGNMFSTKGRFIDHLLKQIPPEELQYQCSCCGRKYATERMVRDHIRHHINHYKCPHCEMTCPSQSSLDTHILYRHSNCKRHPCSHCSKSFKQREDLERHLLAHTDNKLFKCYYADCAFRSKCSASLDSHIKQRHLKMRVVYACHLCSVERTRGNALSQHLMKAHHLSWPTGHSKFFYRLDSEGKFRLQTVRYESLELVEGVDRYAAERAKSDEESAVSERESGLGDRESDGKSDVQKSPSKRKRSASKHPKGTVSSPCKARIAPKTKRKKSDMTKSESKPSTETSGPRRKVSKNPRTVSPKKRAKGGSGRKKKNVTQRGGAKRGRKKLDPRTSDSSQGRKRKATSLANARSNSSSTAKKRKLNSHGIESEGLEQLQTSTEINLSFEESNELEGSLTAENCRSNVSNFESNQELRDTPATHENFSNDSFTSNNTPQSSPCRASMPIIM